MSTAKLNEAVQTPGLYQPEFEHDNCGIGAVVNIKGVKSHGTVENALKIVENLEHRAGKDAEGKTGDGVGIMLQISHKFFSKTCESLGIFLGSEREYGIGMFFFPQDELKKNQAKKMFEMEGSSGCSGTSRTQSTGMYAVYHAGICSKTKTPGKRY